MKRNEWIVMFSIIGYGVFVSLFSFNAGVSTSDVSCPYLSGEGSFRNDFITINQSVMSDLNDLWNESIKLRKEVGVCLDLKKDHVVGFDGEIKRGGETFLNFEDECMEASFHTHPPQNSNERGVCSMSATDGIHLYRGWRDRSMRLEFVMCDFNKLGAWDIRDLERSYKIKIV